jgi:hypothetical protein
VFCLSGIITISSRILSQHKVKAPETLSQNTPHAVAEFEKQKPYGKNIP